MEACKQHSLLQSPLAPAMTKTFFFLRISKISSQVCLCFSWLTKIPWICETITRTPHIELLLVWLPTPNKHTQRIKAQIPVFWIYPNYLIITCNFYFMGKYCPTLLQRDHFIASIYGGGGIWLAHYFFSSTLYAMI